jgi:hypothetical protein
VLFPVCHCKAFLPIWALQVPAVEPGVLRPPGRPSRLAVAAGITTSMGGFPLPVLGVRFGGLRTDQFHLVLPLPSGAQRSAPKRHSRLPSGDPGPRAPGPGAREPGAGSREPGAGRAGGAPAPTSNQQPAASSQQPAAPMSMSICHLIPTNLLSPPARSSSPS